MKSVDEISQTLGEATVMMGAVIHVEVYLKIIMSKGV